MSTAPGLIPNKNTPTVRTLRVPLHLYWCVMYMYTRGRRIRKRVRTRRTKRRRRGTRGRRTKKGAGLGRSKLIHTITHAEEVYYALRDLGAHPAYLPEPPWPEADLLRYERTIEVYKGLRRLGFLPRALPELPWNAHILLRQERILERGRPRQQNLGG